ncbi:unnamed protein product [Rotaria socialis]|uniref:Peptidase M3A/M3B catalytic domain-containing protein n=1 Tax=Rotaria socialis TaxID=392032 RepID=A0A820EHL4_9BILA|nr:unnamed protein product [Rotaria socialis]CAF4246993.1 unnamed protein product [Rotaria socialis]
MQRIIFNPIRLRFQRQILSTLIIPRATSHTKQCNSSIDRDFDAATVSTLDKNLFSNHFRKISPLSWLKTPAKGANVGLFQINELSTPDGFHILAERVVQKCEKLLDECFTPSRRKIVEILDEISDEICRVADLAEFIRNVDVEIAYKQAAEQAYGVLHHLVEKMNTNTKLYEQAKQIYDSGEGDETDRRVLKLYLIDFERSGIRLNDDNRLNYLQLNDDVLHLENQFRYNAHREYKIPIKQLPEKVRTRFYDKTITINSAHSSDDDENLREFIFRSYFRFEPDQEQILDALLRKRYQLAKLCGYPSYSHRALDNTLLNKPEYVSNYLEQIMDAIRPLADKDIKLMQMLKNRLEQNSNTQLVNPWDVARLEAIFKSEILKINTREYTPYFSLGTCMDGLNIIFHSLFNVTLNKQPTAPGEIWHPSVIKLSVDHVTEGTVGYIYCDLFERKDKIPHDCHFTIQCSRRLSDGSCQLPIVVLHVNIPPSADPNVPTLLTLGLVENLFHEFGHAMHSALARTRYQHASGTRCQTDIAEIPSQWMEYFVYEPRVVKLFARHYQTGETIPDELLQRLHLAQNCFQAHRTQVQVACAMFDHEFHGPYPLKQSYDQLYSSLLTKHTSLPYISSTHPYLKFYHLVDYGARFSSYIIARSIATKIWHDQFLKDPLSKTTGEQFRKNFLQWGGEREPNELVGNVFSSTQKITIDHMTKAITDEIKENVQQRDSLFK